MKSTVLPSTKIYASDGFRVLDSRGSHYQTLSKSVFGSISPEHVDTMFDKKTKSAVYFIVTYLHFAFASTNSYFWGNLHIQWKRLEGVHLSLTWHSKSPS